MNSVRPLKAAFNFSVECFAIIMMAIMTIMMMMVKTGSWVRIKKICEIHKIILKIIKKHSLVEGKILKLCLFYEQNLL